MTRRQPIFLLSACVLLTGCMPLVGFERPERDLTDLQRAVLAGNFERVERLVQNRARIDESGGNGRWGTPLQIAVYNAYDEKIAVYLLARGAEASDPGLLQPAIERNSPALVGALLKSGCPVNPTSYQNRNGGWTHPEPYARLSRALRARISLASLSRTGDGLDRNLEVIRLLLEAGAAVPPDEDVSFSNQLLAGDVALHRLAAEHLRRR